MSKSALLDVLRGRKPGRRPVWFMRQAGRYLPEYRELRAKAGSFLDLCYNPALAAEVTLQPLRRFDIDAAILFADILVVPHAMGLGLRFAEGEGPILETVRNEGGVKSLVAVAGTSQVGAVCETVGLVRQDLAPDLALIGFCGGPWTVASYMVEGGSSDRNLARIAAYDQEPWFDQLINRLVEESVSYLCLQVEAGADVVQIFDSWAGELTGAARQRYVFGPIARICAGLKARHPAVPIIAFARGVGTDHSVVAQIGGVSAVGVEAEAPLAGIAEAVPHSVAVQGNLDPVALLASDRALIRETEIVAGAVPMNRHVFNLGHGIRQETDLGKLSLAVETVRRFDQSAASHG